MDRRDLLLGSLGFVLPTLQFSDASSKSICLMIGVEKYDNPRVSSLQYAAKDVTAVAKVLESKFGFNDVRIMTTDATSSNDKPTSNNVIKAIKLLISKLEPADTFIFYFSGHGIMRDGKTYLATQDADPTDDILLERSTLPLELLQSMLKRLKARQVILILDACRNDPDKGKGDSDNRLVGVLSKDLQRVAAEVSTSSGGSSAILFACSQGERAYEEAEFGYSVFTKFLLDALNGNAKSSSLEDVVSYTSTMVEKWAKENGNKQSPDLYTFGTRTLSFGSSTKTNLANEPVEPAVARLSTTIRLEVLGVPLGAVVKVDNVAIAGTTYSEEINGISKTVDVLVTSNMYKPFVDRVMVGRGETRKIFVSMERLPYMGVGPYLPRLNVHTSKFPLLKRYMESLVVIPGGTFTIGRVTGDPDERPLRKVTLSDYRLGATPVTMGVWLEYCIATGSPTPPLPKWGYIENHPVTRVTRNEVLGNGYKTGFCQWVSEVVGYHVTLPTEAQFEYAARGGNRVVTYPWGDKFDIEKLWCSRRNPEDVGGTAPVNRKYRIHRNVFGLTDMVGNVMQWCLDDYVDYSTFGLMDPVGISVGSDTLVSIRGASWDFVNPLAFRCSSRSAAYPVSKGNNIPCLGFRLAALRLSPHRNFSEPVVSTNPFKSKKTTRHPAFRAYIEQLRLIPAGTFEMGSASGDPAEKPPHKVSLSAFRLGVTPVPVAVWKEYCAATGIPLPVPPKWGLIDDHPVVNVSWHDLMGSFGEGGFCAWASDISGFHVTLPTEAQWEFAARGGLNGQTYPWGDTFDESKLWCSSGTKRSQTAPVNRSSNVYRNSSGLTDMVGNVYQWCQDLNSSYTSAAQTNPVGPFSRYDSRRCVRGGSWAFDNPGLFRCAKRGGSDPDGRSDNVSFRLSAGPG